MQPQSKPCKWHIHLHPRAGEATIVLIVSLLVWGWTQWMSPFIPAGSILRTAAEHGDVWTIDRASAAELNEPDHAGTLPLVAAARCGQAGAVEAILRRGVDPNAPVPFYGKAIIVAASMGCTEVVRVLLLHGATLDGRDDLGRDALIAAASSSSTSCIRLLLDAGASLQNTDNEGFTARQRAVENKNIDCILLLNTQPSNHTPALSEKPFKN